ncbi:MAG TPA: hypothetical protein VIK89_15690 [Cytophagaceae bacterium]
MEQNTNTNSDTFNIYTNDILKDKSGMQFKVVGFKVSDSGFLDSTQLILKPYPIDFTRQARIETDKETIIREGWVKVRI